MTGTRTFISLHNARETLRRSFKILKTVLMLTESHIGILAAFYLLNYYFSTAPQLLGPFILPRLQMKNSENYLPVCSKSKVMIKYIENTNSRYFNYFCFPMALFW